MSTQRTTIQARARSDALRLLRTINDTQAHGEEGARANPIGAAHEAALDLGCWRHEEATAYLIEQAALLGEAHMASSDDVGDQHPHGYALATSSRGGRWCCWRDDGSRLGYPSVCVEGLLYELRLYGVL